MIWGYIYLFVLLSVLVYVQWAGERETRFAIWTVFVASVLTPAALIISGTRFETFSLLLTLLDFVMLAVYLGHALVSRRYWTLCLPAFQLITCMTHLTKLVLPDLWPRLYSAGQGFWAYPQMLAIVLATAWFQADRRRRRKQNDDPARRNAR